MQVMYILCYDKKICSKCCNKIFFTNLIYMRLINKIDLK